MLINWIMMKKNNAAQSSVIWNAIGGMLNAGQSAIILIFVSYNLGLIEAGIVTIAYAIANLFLAIGKYGVRNYQVTDVKSKYSFGDYFYQRVLVVILVLVSLCIYVFSNLISYSYSVEKAIIVFEISCLKLVDALEDVYLGQYQQQGRLDVAAKIIAVRLFVSTAIICLMIFAGSELYIAFLVGIVLSILLDIHFIRRTFEIANACIGKIQWKNIVQLMQTCFPLCVGATLSIYVGNVPKYIIDEYMDETVQAIFGYIMMPVFVIMLLSNFIFQPMIKKYGELWNDHQSEKLRRVIIKQSFSVGVLTIFVMVAGKIIGIPILSIIYNTDLSPYQIEFVLLLLGGGLYAMAYYLTVLLTTIRKHKYIAWGYLAVALFAMLLGKSFVGRAGMLGVVYLYLCINIFLVILYTCILINGLSTIKNVIWSK